MLSIYKIRTSDAINRNIIALKKLQIMSKMMSSIKSMNFFHLTHAFRVYLFNVQ